jgi:hypothetical protein
MDQNVYVQYAGGPNFSYLTTVIAINFEAPQPLDLKKHEVSLAHNFYFQQILLLPKIDQTHG